MKSCPNCGELVGDNVETCFNCGYDFRLHRMPSHRESYAQDGEEERFKRQLAEINAKKQETVFKNAYYEYRTEYLYDNSEGELSKQDLDNVLSGYAADGWRLHTMVVNEIGKNVSTVGVAGFSGGVNVTVEVTILVFERCVKPAEY